MTTFVRYHDGPWHQKYHKPESGYLIRRYTCADKYSGLTVTTWVVRCPVTYHTLHEAETEAAARQWARARKEAAA